VLAATATHEIAAGKNWRNLRVVAVLSVLIAGNAVWHAEWMISGAGDYGPRIAVAAVIALIMVIGGRIVPSFTHNWLARMNPGRMPRPFARFDAVAVVAGAVALGAWIAAPHYAVAGALLLIAGVLHMVRLARWAGDRTVADRLVLVLHVGYAFVPLGFLLVGASTLVPAIPQTAGVHAWTAGAASLMPLAVMTRASLGHTGRPLVATPAIQAIYAFAVIGALARIAAAFVAPWLFLHVAAFAWILAFGGFAAVYGPLLVLRRPAANPSC
jgi:uncharacterized protein involved in response to NO